MEWLGICFILAGWAFILCIWTWLNGRWAKRAAISLAWNLLADGDDVTDYQHTCLIEMGPDGRPDYHCIRCELKKSGVVVRGELVSHPEKYADRKSWRERR